MKKLKTDVTVFMILLGQSINICDCPAGLGMCLLLNRVQFAILYVRIALLVALEENILNRNLSECIKLM
jgi:hypothetical protein